MHKYSRKIRIVLVSPIVTNVQANIAINAMIIIVWIQIHSDALTCKLMEAILLT